MYPPRETDTMTVCANSDRKQNYYFSSCSRKQCFYRVSMVLRQECYESMTNLFVLITKSDIFFHLLLSNYSVKLYH